MTVILDHTLDLTSDDFLRWLTQDGRKVGDETSGEDGNHSLPTARMPVARTRSAGVFQTEVFTAEDQVWGLYAKAVLVASPVINVLIKNIVAVEVLVRLYINTNLVVDPAVVEKIVAAFESFTVDGSPTTEVAKGFDSGISEDMYSVVAFASVKVIKLGVVMNDPGLIFRDLFQGKLKGGVGDDSNEMPWPEKVAEDAMEPRLMSRRRRLRFEPPHYDYSRQIDRSDEQDPRRDWQPETIVASVAKENGAKLDCNRIESKAFKIGTVFEWPEYKVELRFRKEKVGCVVLWIPEIVVQQRKSMIVGYVYLYYPERTDEYAIEQMMDCAKMAAATFVVVLIYTDLAIAIASLKGAFWLCVKVKAVKGIDDIQRCISPDIVTITETTEWGPLTPFLPARRKDAELGNRKYLD